MTYYMCAAIVKRPDRSFVCVCVCIKEQRRENKKKSGWMDAGERAERAASACMPLNYERRHVSIRTHGARARPSIGCICRELGRTSWIITHVVPWERWFWLSLGFASGGMDRYLEEEDDEILTGLHLMTMSSDVGFQDGNC